MAKVKIQGHASGTGILTVTAPNTSTDRTITLPDATGTLATTADVFDPDGAVTINDTGADVDFRVESNNVANMLFVDGGNDMVLIGTDTPISFDAFGSEISVQIQGAGTAPYTGLGIVQNSNDGDAAVLILGKSRGTSVGSTTIVQDGDDCGRIEFQGMDGTDLETCASIFGEVDGTPGSGDMPGRLSFRTTADGADSATERLRITSDGRGLSQFTAKVWCKFNGTGTPAIDDSHNCSSLTDNGTGDYTLNFTNNMANTNYVKFADAKDVNHNSALIILHSTDTFAVGSMQLLCQNALGTALDDTNMHALVFGD